ncbi:MAG: J domain-containing protein [Chloroflexi bacterium]|nr:J domain-containing protein [Chloroflexota bacterium]
MNYKDYYKILGVPKSADDKEIRRAFRKLAQQYHPDKNPGNKQAEEKFKDLNEAHQVLSDPQKRAKYDQLGSSYAQWERMGGQPGGFDWSQWTPGGGGTRVDFGDLGDLFGDGSFSDFFQTLFGGVPRGGRPAGGGGSSRRVAGQNMEQPIEITLEEAYTGASRTLQKDGRRLQVKIPAGARTGTRVRIRGEGNPGPGGAGDLYLVITVKPHPIFERKEDDLYMDLKLDLYTAVLGGEARVETPGGAVLLTIPAESQSGQTFRLAGKGMPHLRSHDKRGDLYVMLAVQTPRNLSSKERTLFSELAALRRDSSD